jgi:hypothetical protein
MWVTQRLTELEETVLAQTVARYLGGFESDNDLRKIRPITEYPEEVHRSGGHPVSGLPDSLEADGGAVPFVVVAALPALFVGALVPPVVNTAVLPAGYEVVARLPVWWLAGGGYAGFLLVVKAYHDTALVGGGDAVVAADDPGAPVAAADAAGTEDPPGTALACLREAGAEECVRVLGRVRPDEEGVELVDGVVTTRGTGFLAVAAVAGTVRGGGVALALAVAGTGTPYLAWLAV